MRGFGRQSLPQVHRKSPDPQGHPHCNRFIARYHLRLHRMRPEHNCVTVGLLGEPLAAGTGEKMTTPSAVQSLDGLLLNRPHDALAKQLGTQSVPLP